MRTRGLIRILVAVAALTATVACGTPETPPEEPVATVLRLLETVRADSIDETRLDALFEMDDDGMWRAELLDALDALPDSSDLEIRGVDRLDGLGRAVVDVTFGVAAGSESDYSIQLEREDDSDWRVVGFHGPGVSWPPRRRPRDSGLTTWPAS